MPRLSNPEGGLTAKILQVRPSLIHIGVVRLALSIRM